MEVRFGGRTVADPAGGDFGVALDRRGHGPADGLHELRAEIAGDREKAMLLGRIHDRKLPPLEGIAFIRIDLVHHLDHGIAAGNQQAGLPIGRKIHVSWKQGLAEGAAHGFLAHVLHIEGCLALALRHHHACVEGPQRHHVPQALRQLVIRQCACPRADGLTLTVQDADDRISEIAERFGIGVDFRAPDRSRIRDRDIRKIGRPAGTHRRLRNVEPQRCAIGHAFSSRRGSPVPGRTRGLTTQANYIRMPRSSSRAG